MVLFYVQKQEQVMVARKYGLNIVHMCQKIWAGNSLHLLEK